MGRCLARARRIRVVATMAQLSEYWPGFRRSMDKVPVVGLALHWVPANTHLHQRPPPTQEELDMDPFKDIVYEGDVESVVWKGRRRTAGLGLLALATFEGEVLLVRVNLLGGLPELLSSLLSTPRILKVGQGLEREKGMLRDLHETHIAGLVEVRTAMVEWGYLVGRWPDERSFGAAALWRWFLGRHRLIDPPPGGDWAPIRLSRHQIAFAAQEAQLLVDTVALVQLRHFGWRLQPDWHAHGHFGQALYHYLAGIVDQPFGRLTLNSRSFSTNAIKSAQDVTAKIAKVEKLLETVNGSLPDGPRFHDLTLWAWPIPSTEKAIQALVGRLRSASPCHRWPALLGSERLLDAEEREKEAEETQEEETSGGDGDGKGGEKGRSGKVFVGFDPARSRRYRIRVTVTKVAESEGGDGGGCAENVYGAFGSEGSAGAADDPIAQAAPRLQAAARAKIVFVQQHAEWEEMEQASAEAKRAEPVAEVASAGSLWRLCPELEVEEAREAREGKPRRPPKERKAKRVRDKHRPRGPDVRGMEQLFLDQGAEWLDSCGPGVAEGAMPFFPPELRARSAKDSRLETTAGQGFAAPVALLEAPFFPVLSPSAGVVLAPEPAQPKPAAPPRKASVSSGGRFSDGHASWDPKWELASPVQPTRQQPLPTLMAETALPPPGFTFGSNGVFGASGSAFGSTGSIYGGKQRGSEGESMGRGVGGSPAKVGLGGGTRRGPDAQIRQPLIGPTPQPYPMRPPQPPSAQPDFSQSGISFGGYKADPRTFQTEPVRPPPQPVQYQPGVFGQSQPPQSPPPPAPPAKSPRSRKGGQWKPPVYQETPTGWNSGFTDEETQNTHKEGAATEKSRASASSRKEDEAIWNLSPALLPGPPQPPFQPQSQGPSSGFLPLQGAPMGGFSALGMDFQHRPPRPPMGPGQGPPHRRPGPPPAHLGGGGRFGGFAPHSRPRGPPPMGDLGPGPVWSSNSPVSNGPLGGDGPPRPPQHFGGLGGQQGAPSGHGFAQQGGGFGGFGGGGSGGGSFGQGSMGGFAALGSDGGPASGLSFWQPPPGPFGHQEPGPPAHPPPDAFPGSFPGARGGRPPQRAPRMPHLRPPVTTYTGFEGQGFHGQDLMNKDFKDEDFMDQCLGHSLRHNDLLHSLRHLLWRYSTSSIASGPFHDMLHSLRLFITGKLLLQA